MPVLRVFNGDSAAASFARVRSRAAVLVSRDVVAAGPAPASFGPAWIDARAGYLSTAYGADAARCREDLEHFEKAFAAAMGSCDIDLWYGRDLFCLLVMLSHGARLAGADLGTTRLGLVCPDGSQREPRFHCLGDLSPESLAALEVEREPLDASWLAAAAAAWAAYTAPEPTALNRRPPQRRIRRALELHAARFPSLATGLGRIEQTALERLEDGPASFSELFTHHCEALPDYGWGDLQLAMDLLALAERGQPLVAVENGTYTLTGHGRDVLAGDAEVGAAARARWLGGVELIPGHPWRYDAGSGQVVRVA